MANKSYIEDSSFELPVLKNGVQGLGDLWDCRESAPLHLNLFSNNLNEECLRVHPIKEKKSFFYHMKSSRDKLETLDINGELGLEVLAGLIKAGGSVKFESKISNDEILECLTFRHDLSTFSIDVLPSAKVDEHVKKILLDKRQKATHFVKKVVIGAVIDINITATHKISHNSKNISGNFYNCFNNFSVSLSFKIGSLFGKFKKGPVDISGEFNTEYGNTDNEEHVETKLTTESKP